MMWFFSGIATYYPFYNNTEVNQIELLITFDTKHRHQREHVNKLYVQDYSR